MTPCPKCMRQNAEDALYCDQCRTAVSPQAGGSEHEDPCPACGGTVREVPSVLAVCADCGIALGEGGPGGQDCRLPQPEAAAPAPHAQDAAEEDGEKSPCPVCGTGNVETALQCGGCRIAFDKPRLPLACPKCEAETMDEKCACGAILTLPRLLGYVDASVKVVCSVCKQLFTVARDSCSDCGGETRPVDGLREHAASGRR
ncbi:MAG: zinc ribbon domain-containing protein [Elusimicrobia bacterium]|nr:zinc ribbon domain-containing protein [Elusimicrobiota bacterium]